MNIVPKNCSITASELAGEGQSNPPSTITAKQVASLLRCIARDDQKKQLKITWRSPIKESSNNGKKFIEITAEGYHFGLFVDTTLNQVSNCFICVTPMRALYNVDMPVPDEQGNGVVSSFLSQEDGDLLSKAVFANTGERKVGIRTFYKIMMDFDACNENGLGTMYNHGPSPDGKEFPKEIGSSGTYFTSHEDAEKVLKKYLAYREAKEQAKLKQKKVKK